MSGVLNGSTAGTMGVHCEAPAVVLVLPYAHGLQAVAEVLANKPGEQRRQAAFGDEAPVAIPIEPLGLRTFTGEETRQIAQQHS